MDIHLSFYATASAMAKLFILMLVGYTVYRKKLVTSEFVDTLSRLLINIIFPSLIFYKTVSHFSFNEYPFWWALPVIAAGFSIFGMLLGKITVGFLKDFRSQKEFFCAAGFQNCGYLPMNLILFSFAGVLRDRLLIYMFLFIIGFNLLMWSIVPFYLKSGRKMPFHPKVLLNPPVIATVLSLLWVAIFGKGTVPQVIMDPVGQLGQASFPLAMLTLGAYLCRYSAHRPAAGLPVITAVFLKLLVFPLLVLLVLCAVRAGNDLGFFLLLEAAMPTAVSLVVVGSYTGADNRFFSSVVFYSHLAAIFTIPLWIEIYNAIFKA